MNGGKRFLDYFDRRAADGSKSVWLNLPIIKVCMLLVLILIWIYLLTAIGLTPGGSSTVHIYKQTIHRTAQLTSLVGKLSGIWTQSGQTKINVELTA